MMRVLRAGPRQRTAQHGERRAGMSDTVFISYHPADASRAGIIAGALRAEGLMVTGDLSVPAGTLRREMFGDALADAWVVVSLLSPRAVADAELVEEAAGALARGAYLGATIDGVRPPAALANGETVDLGGWGGGRDRKLAELIEAVKGRLRPAAAAPAGPPPIFESKRGRSGGSRGTITAVMIAVLVAIGVIFVVMTRRTTTDHAAEIRTRLASIPCAWLKVDPVDNGSNGTLALTGVADDPARAGEVIRGLTRDDHEPATVTIDRIARIGSNDCPAIVAAQRSRHVDGGAIVRSDPRDAVDRHRRRLMV
ncbi:MAG: toll/interleukin-1 receptor domain-containing protein, partial [Sphingomonas sp.]